jgi:hypothetical protein
MGRKATIKNIVRTISPKFEKDDNLSYDNCAIGAGASLGSNNYYIHLIECIKSNQFIVEVPNQDRNKWLPIIDKHKVTPSVLIDEQWDGWAVGLRRTYDSPDDLETKLAALLDEFLNCIETEMTPKPITP